MLCWDGAELLQVNYGVVNCVDLRVNFCDDLEKKVYEK